MKKLGWTECEIVELEIDAQSLVGVVVEELLDSAVEDVHLAAGAEQRDVVDRLDVEVPRHSGAVDRLDPAVEPNRRAAEQLAVPQVPLQDPRHLTDVESPRQLEQVDVVELRRKGQLRVARQ